MVLVLYNLILFLTFPLWLPWMIWRSKKRKEAPNWDERSGSYQKVIPAKKKGELRIWVHAVSVGEVVAVLPILKELRSQCPAAKIILSVTTSSGHKTASDQATGLYDYLVYFPIDIARFQLYAMARVRPDVVAIMETELWMNFLYNARSFEAKTLLINGRVSDKSFARSGAIRWFYRALFKYIDRCLVQSPTDAERIKAFGGHNVEVFGNCKFDQAVDAIGNTEPKSPWFATESVLPTVVVGSTRSELEETLVISALTELKQEGVEFRVIHAPRHIERAAGIVAAVEATGQWSVGQRSVATQGDYLILDTYGELTTAYAGATVAIIGGGFDRLGGQNLIQPLALGVPVIHGPNMFNFKDSTEEALRAGASIRVEPEVAPLKAAIKQLLQNPEERAQRSAAAKALVQNNLGASKRYAEAIVASLVG